MPKLTERLGTKEELEKVFDLEKICLSEENLLIIGGKESGKTVLLDRILVEFLEKINVYNKIPIFIDIDKCGNNLESEIRKYTGVKFKDTQEFMENQNIVLLIDGLSASRRQMTKIRNLESLMEKYINISVIATADSLISSDIPIELKKYSSISKFKPVQINSFRSREIKQLIEKWFSSKIEVQWESSYEEILRIFEKLDIPHTPLAISMFLCIFESQPNYTPANSTTLLENFIEIMLDKHSLEELMRDDFDYKNKTRLLADIAYQMFEKGDKNYRLNRLNLMQFIEQHMQNRKFTFIKADDILNDFERRGIFIEENDDGLFYLRFRFKCFFEFFLMRNMENRKAFKEYVISEENYLYFLDEIEYFSGIRRDETDLLIELTNRMTMRFDEFVKENEKLQDVDFIFDSKVNGDSDISSELLQNYEKIEKKSDESINEANDSKLEIAEVNQMKNEIQSKGEKEELSLYRKLERSWIVVAKVLRNTEEFDDGDLRNNVYKEMLKCAAIFTASARLVLEESEKDLSISEEEKKALEQLLTYLPLGVQMYLNNLLSSNKMSGVMEADVIEKLKNDEFPEIETMLSVLLLLDSKSSKKMKYTSEFVKRHKKKFVRENLIIKLFYNYKMLPVKNNLEVEYLNLLGELRTLNLTQSSKHFHKSKVIEAYKKAKATEIDNDSNSEE